jgi:hypothetical protein
MLKTSTIVACVLALWGSAAMAQNWPSQWMPPGPNDAPGGANGPARARDIGSPSANVNQTVGGRTTSTTILSQTNKQQSAAGASHSDYTSQAQLQNGIRPSGSRGNVYMTDEYGFKYDSRGNRLDARGNPMR